MALKRKSERIITMNNIAVNEMQLFQKMFEISKECYRLELSRKTKEGIKNSKKMKNKECAKNDIK